MLPDPTRPGRNRGPNKGLALLLAVLAIAIVGGGLFLLATRYANSGSGTSVALVSPTPQALALPATSTSQAPTSVALVTPLRPGGLSGPQVFTATPPPTPTASATPTHAPSSTPLPSPTTPLSATPTASPTVALLPAEQSRLVLDAADVPVRDLYSITARLRLKSPRILPHTTDRPAGNYKAGHSDKFYMSDIIAKRYYTITATIQEVTDHAYWYAQDGHAVSKEAIHNAAQTFESKIYPTDRRLFGSEWTPGVDNDHRITVLFAPIVGAGGYYASADEYTRAINPFSNEREIIYINTGTGWDGIEGTLAHEFQHMIHWHEYSHHDVWLNEGASVLATVLNGYEGVGVDGDFMREPGVQLNAWQASPDAARANYGASMLFLDYVRTHYGGDKVLRDVVSTPGQGIEVIDRALSSLGSSDRFIDVFRKWTLANLLDGQPGAADAGLDYPDRDVEVSPQTSITRYPKSLTDSVSQFGTRYVALLPPANGDTLHVAFSGQPTTRIIPTDPHSGSSMWYSNRGDLADSTTTRRFDLRGLSSGTLDFYAWYDIEEDLDYAYVEASTDGGATWSTLHGSHTTGANPNGYNLGNAYTGKSALNPDADTGGWLHERANLAAYAGKEVLLRFEYITDDGYNAAGFAVDDISIPELGYSDNAEAPDGWQGAGFVRVANELPQTYYLAVVKFKDKGFDVQPVEVNAEGTTTFNIGGLGPGGTYNKAVLVIAGTTNHTLQPADYELNISGK